MAWSLPPAQQAPKIQPAPVALTTALPSVAPALLLGALDEPGAHSWIAVALQVQLAALSSARVLAQALAQALAQGRVAVQD